MESEERIHRGDQFGKIFRHGSWYFITSLLTKATSFFLLPVYTKYLSPADYGLLNTLNSFSNLIPIFISLYVDSAFGRYYFQEKEISRARVTLLYSTLFWFICIWGAAVTIVALVLAGRTLTNVVNVPFFPFIPLTVIPPIFGQLSLLGSIYLRNNLKAIEISIISLCSFIVSTATIVILLVILKFGVLANLYGGALGILVSFFYFLYISKKYDLLLFVFDWKVLKMCLLFSLPLIPNIAGGWIAGLSDRLILSYYGKIEQTGLYSVSAQIAMVLYFINDAMTQVQGPVALSALTENREEGKKQISEFLSFFVWMILFFYLCLTFFSKEIIALMTDSRYHSAYQLVAVLGFSYVLSGFYRVFTTILSFHQKMWVISSAAIISAIISMILNFLFIPYWGQWAAAWAGLFSVSGYTAWLYYWSQRVDPIRINYQLIITSLSIAAILLAIEKIIEIGRWIGFWSELYLKIILAGVYIFMIFFLPSLNEVKAVNMDLWTRLSRR